MKTKNVFLFKKFSFHNTLYTSKQLSVRYQKHVDKFVQIQQGPTTNKINRHVFNGKKSLGTSGLEKEEIVIFGSVDNLIL